MGGAAWEGKQAAPARDRHYGRRNWTIWLSDSHIVPAMTTRSVAEARNQLSQLIDRALKGEPVVITRLGQPVVELKPLAPAPDSTGRGYSPRGITADGLKWLESRRLQLAPGAEDAVTIVRRMRDEDDL